MAVGHRFEELAAERDLLVFAGGIRRNDLQVRLKYAGLDAQLIDDAHDLFGRLSNVPAEVKAYLIAKLHGASSRSCRHGRAGRC